MLETGSFTLQPFAPDALIDGLSLAGQVARAPGGIVIEYRLTGALAALLLAENGESPGRCHELWRQSCFELFFGRPGDTGYWEVNLSPQGNWNIYRFSAYRAGMREEPLAVQPVCQRVVKEDFLSLACIIDHTAFISDTDDLELAIASVIEHPQGNLSYWALKHPDRQPDFHNRASFTILLPGTNIMHK